MECNNIIFRATVPGSFNSLAKINWPCTCSTHAIVLLAIVTKFQFAINLM